MPSAGSTVGRVALITSRFQSEYPLDPQALAHLSESFKQGWADPSKVSSDSALLRPLLAEAKATFAKYFGVRSDEIYFVGEPPLGFHLTINGLIGDGVLHYNATDRQPVHAIVQQRENNNLPNHLHQSNTVGEDIDEPGCLSDLHDLQIYQPINPETGIERPAPHTKARLVVDNTAFGLSPQLPTNWQGAIWQSRSWHGPSGLGVIAIRTGAHWRNPLPSIDVEKVPQSFSIPLLLASAVALENFAQSFEKTKEEISHLNARIRNYFTDVIGEVSIAGEEDRSRPHLISVAISGVDSEKLVKDLADRGFAVDSGSACLSSNMAPSHVLAAMGLPTTGNLRLTLHPQTSADEVEALMVATKELIMQQRTAL